MANEVKSTGGRESEGLHPAVYLGIIAILCAIIGVQAYQLRMERETNRNSDRLTDFLTRESVQHRVPASTNRAGGE